MYLDLFTSPRELSIFVIIFSGRVMVILIVINDIISTIYKTRIPNQFKGRILTKLVTKNNDKLPKNRRRLTESVMSNRKNKLYRFGFNRAAFYELTTNQRKRLLDILLIIGQKGPLTSTNISNSYDSKYAYEILKKLIHVESESMPLFDWSELHSTLEPKKTHELYKVLDNLLGLKWKISISNDGETNNLDLSVSERNNFVTLSCDSHKLNLELDSEGKIISRLYKGGKEIKSYNFIVKKKGIKRLVYSKVAFNPLFKEREFVKVTSKGTTDYYQLNLRGFLLLLRLISDAKTKSRGLESYRKELEHVLFNLESYNEIYFLRNWQDFTKFKFDVITTLIEIANNLYKLVLDASIIEEHLIYIATIQYLSKLKAFFYWHNPLVPDVYYGYWEKVLKKLIEFHAKELETIKKQFEPPEYLRRYVSKIKSEP